MNETGTGAWLRLMVPLAAAMLLVGCATRHIDWNSRIGTYTYEQAVLDNGPPDKVATLTDGTIVGEWLISRGRIYSYPGAGFGDYPGYYGPAYSGYISSSPDNYLRLTFRPDGRLLSWKQLYR